MHANLLFYSNYDFQKIVGFFNIEKGILHLIDRNRKYVRE